jgi:hypothetical protein
MTAKALDTKAINACNEALRTARKALNAAKAAGDKDAAKASRQAIDKAYRERDVLVGLREKVDGPRVKGPMGEHLAPEVLSALGRSATPKAAASSASLDAMRIKPEEKTAADLGPTIAKWDPKLRKLVPGPGCTPELAEKFGFTEAAAPGPSLSAVAPTGDITLPGGDAPAIQVVGDAGATEAPAAPNALPPRVLGHFRSVGKAQTVEEVAVALGVDRKKVGDVLGKLFKAGKLAREGAGVYAPAPAVEK